MPALDSTGTTWQRPSTWVTAAANEDTVAVGYVSAHNVDGAESWIPAATSLHAAHAAFLNLPDPWTGFQVGSPIISNGPDLTSEEALANLQDALTNATDAATTGLQHAADGSEALVWASLLACYAVGRAWCASPADTWAAPIPGTVVPSRLTMASIGDATIDALNKCFALNFCLTTAQGRTDRSGRLHSDLAARAPQVAALVGTLQGLIPDQAQTPQLSYPLANQLGSDADISAAWGVLEAELAQSCTYLAACLAANQQFDDATTVASAAGDQWSLASRMGHPITWWPGWPVA